MYSIYLEKHFVASAKKLENKIKEELDNNLQLLETNPAHPHLHLKPLHGHLGGLYSFRVKEYRVIVEFLKNKKIRIIEIEKRDKVYK